MTGDQLNESIQLVVLGLRAQLAEEARVGWKGSRSESAVSKIVEHVAEVRSVAVDEVGSVVVLTQSVTTAKHGG